MLLLTFLAEVVECMACSDNVVRAGLTIKHRDKDTLCQMLTYRTGSPEDNKFLSQPHPLFPSVSIYDPPTPEFAVARIVIPKESKQFTLPKVTGKILFQLNIYTCGLISITVKKWDVFMF